VRTKMEWGKVTAVNGKPSMGSTPIEIEVADLPAMPKPERNLAEGIKSLYQTCQMYDLNLVVGKTSLPAHKVVLASMSSACCEQVRKAVADFEQGRSSPSVREQAKVEKEAPATPGPVAQAEAPPAASPPVYSNQWKSEGPPNAGSAAPEGEKPVAPTAPAAPTAPTAPTAPVSPKSDDGAEKARNSSRPELFLEIESPEAARALLDMLYGLGSEYNITTDEANKDVLRLAKQLDVPSLQELAMGYLARDVTTENAVNRLQTCREFDLHELYESIEEEVVINREALEQVAGDEEVMKHPEILQGLLLRSARIHRPVPAPKRKRDDEPKVRPEKVKVAKTRAVGGA